MRRTPAPPSFARIVPALAAAAAVCSLPLVPPFAVPASPLYLGRLANDMPDGPAFAVFAVVLDGTILGTVVAVGVGLPVILLLSRTRLWGLPAVFVVGGMTGVLASQVVCVLQHFRQEGLRQFACSWQSPALGVVCGVFAATAFAWMSGMLARRGSAV